MSKDKTIEVLKLRKEVLELEIRLLELKQKTPQLPTFIPTVWPTPNTGTGTPVRWPYTYCRILCHRVQQKLRYQLEIHCVKEKWNLLNTDTRTPTNTYWQFRGKGPIQKLIDKERPEDGSLLVKVYGFRLNN